MLEGVDLAVQPVVLDDGPRTGEGGAGHVLQPLCDELALACGLGGGVRGAATQVLERVLAQPGVRRALPGEFSQRAVLNGRLDLTQAEAISELVAARSRLAADLAMAWLDGGIQQRITALRERLLDQLTELEARVDFEEDLPPLDGDAPALGALLGDGRLLFAPACRQWAR